VSEIVESPSAPDPGIAVEQQGPNRVVFRIYREVWEGAVEVGRIEVDIAKAPRPADLDHRAATRPAQDGP
jgi:hypothetical protein